MFDSSARQRLERLATLAETAQLLFLFLYRKYFPREYAASTASVKIPIGRDGEVGYSEREQEFLRLVDQRLFPLADFFFDDGRFPNVPLNPHKEWTMKLMPNTCASRSGWGGRSGAKMARLNGRSGCPKTYDRDPRN